MTSSKWPQKNLHELVDEGQFEIIKNLVFFDINLIDTVDDVYAKTPLIACAPKSSKSHLQIAQYLIDCGCK